jgi:hypothetical protein
MLAPMVTPQTSKLFSFVPPRSSSAPGARQPRRSFKVFSVAGDAAAALSPFQTFCAASDVAEILEAFQCLQASAAKPSYRHDQLLRKLREKAALYCHKRCAGQRVAVCGSGPCGLRCAVELLLLGADVTIVEKRATFTRSNILHLWEWVVRDLTSLGAKMLYPRFNSSSSYAHVGTKELQGVLLKVCLLLGARFLPGTECLELVGPAGDAAAAAAAGSGSASLWGMRCSPPIGSASGAPGDTRGPADGAGGANGNAFHMVVDAGGRHTSITRQLAFDFKEFRSAGAIGLVAHFKNGRTPAEACCKEFSRSSQFHPALFRRLHAATGLLLENCVYYRGETHYFVMTPKKKSLLQLGVLKDGRGGAAQRGLLQKGNVDQQELRNVSRAVAEFFGLPVAAAGGGGSGGGCSGSGGGGGGGGEGEGGGEGKGEGEGEGGGIPLEGEPLLFDFSSRRRAVLAAKIITAAPLAEAPAAEAAATGSSTATPTMSTSSPTAAAGGGRTLLVSLVGDSLMEPFWPEGLGISRGFLSALDAAWLAGRRGGQPPPLRPAPSPASASSALPTPSPPAEHEPGADAELLVQCESAYKVLQQVTGLSRGLLKDCSSSVYTADPGSRYKSLKY